MNLKYPARFYSETNGQFVVVIPDLNDATTYGDDLEDAIYMAKDLLGSLLLSYLDDNKEIPNPSNVEDIEMDLNNGFVTLVSIDLSKYDAECGNRAVKKNCTIPAWMNKACEKEGFNFSEILQDGIKKKLGL